MDSLCQRDVLWHYCYMLCMDSAHVGILKQVCQVVFCSLPQNLDSMHLKVEVIGPLCLGNFMNQMQKWPFVDEQFHAPLVLPYSMESNSPQSVPLRLFQATDQKFLAGVCSFPEVKGVSPTSATICTSSLLGEDPGNLPTASTPLSHLLLSSSLVEGSILLGEVSGSAHLLQPVLGVSLVLNI